MDIRNCILAVWNQLTRKWAWRNIFVTHNAFGIFSRYSIYPDARVSQRFPTPQRKLHYVQLKRWVRNMAYTSPYISVHGAMGGILVRTRRTKL